MIEVFPHRDIVTLTKVKDLKISSTDSQDKGFYDTSELIYTLPCLKCSPCAELLRLPSACLQSDDP